MCCPLLLPSERLSRADFIGDSGLDDVAQVCAEGLATLVEQLNAQPVIASFLDIIPVEELASNAISALFKKGFTTLSTSGIVLAGFGAAEYYPRMEIYRHHGMVLGKTVCACSESIKIGQDNTSEIVPMAQSEMVKTFVHGIGTSVLREVAGTFGTTLEVLEENLKEVGIIGADVDVSLQMKAAKEAFEDCLTETFVERHTTPMKQVVGMLPIGELAELAEILIRIESLKERVTRESEQVGGPVDVAVISKGDGFIWVKRKHYFDPTINLGYLARKGVPVSVGKP